MIRKFIASVLALSVISLAGMTSLAYTDYSAVNISSDLSYDATDYLISSNNGKILNAETSGQENNGIESFVSRLYRICLQREPDADGLKYWSDMLSQKRGTGTSVAFGFIFSKEFQDKSCSNEEYVELMYEAFLGRESDPAGKSDWVSKMNSGMTRQELFAGFSYSDEFNNICAKSGIVRGNYFAGRDANTVARVDLFVDRLYYTVLGRSGDAAGMRNWTQKLLDGERTGTSAASGFFFSQEYVNRKKSDAEYITDLYYAFLGREPDQAGLASWKSELIKGRSRYYVFNGFACSDEFSSICASYGINRGSGIKDPYSVNVPSQSGQVVSTTYTWMSHDGKYSMSLQLSVDPAVLQDYRTRTRQLDYRRGSEYFFFENDYVTESYNRAFTKSVADSISSMCSDKGYNRYETALEAIRFVQEIPYSYDENTHPGFIDWPSYPVETVFDRTGDCEDFTILLAGILTGLGFDVVFLNFPGHIMVGIADIPREYMYRGSIIHYSFEGKDYYPIESTNAGWRIGQMPAEFDAAHVYRAG